MAEIDLTTASTSTPSPLTPRALPRSSSGPAPSLPIRPRASPGSGTSPAFRVACLTAAVQSLHHLGYDPDEKIIDMRLLADRFGYRAAGAIPAVTESMTLIYAHRGVSAIHPENTLRAFRHALAIGVDGIELDVHATADGIPVVIHDRDVGRTTDGSGYVDQIPLARLATFDAGDGERVPTLAEVSRWSAMPRTWTSRSRDPHRARGAGRACRATPLSGGPSPHSPGTRCAPCDGWTRSPSSGRSPSALATT